MSYNFQILKKYKNNLFGLTCAFFSYFCYGLSNSFAKKSSEHFNICQVVFVRQILILIIAAFIIIFIRKNLDLFKTKRIKTHIIRSISGLVDLLMCFLAVQYISLSDVSGLAFSHGVFVLFLTPILMKEQISKGSGISVLLGTIGTIIIAAPSPDMNITGSFLALSSGFFMALSIVFIRILSETDKSETILFYFSLLSSLMVLIVSIVTGANFVWDKKYIIDLFIASGSGMFAQIFLTTAVIYITPSICSIIAYTTMIWMSIFGYIMYDELPKINFYIGSFFIVAAGIYITIVRLKIENIKKTMQ